MLFLNTMRVFEPNCLTYPGMVVCPLIPSLKHLGCYESHALVDEPRALFHLRRTSHAFRFECEFNDRWAIRLDLDDDSFSLSSPFGSEYVALDLKDKLDYRNECAYRLPQGGSELFTWQYTLTEAKPWLGWGWLRMADPDEVVGMIVRRVAERSQALAKALVRRVPSILEGAVRDLNNRVSQLPDAVRERFKLTGWINQPIAETLLADLRDEFPNSVAITDRVSFYFDQQELWLVWTRSDATLTGRARQFLRSFLSKSAYDLVVKEIAKPQSSGKQVIGEAELDRDLIDSIYACRDMRERLERWMRHYRSVLMTGRLHLTQLIGTLDDLKGLDELDGFAFGL